MLNPDPTTRIDLFSLYYFVLFLFLVILCDDVVDTSNSLAVKCVYQHSYSSYCCLLSMSGDRENSSSCKSGTWPLPNSDALVLCRDVDFRYCLSRF